MRIRRAYIGWPCVHGSMYLVTATLSCHNSTVPPCRHVTRRPWHRVIIPPCHLSHRATCYQHVAPVAQWQLVRHRDTTVPPATNMLQPCRCITWCGPVQPPCHRVTWYTTVALLCHRSTWCATEILQCHLSTWCATETPPFFSATWCAIKTPQCHPARWCANETPPCLRSTCCAIEAPPWHRAAGPPPYRHPTSSYLRTPTHIAYFTTHLTAVNHTTVPSDIVSRNFTIWPVAKNSRDYCNGNCRRTISFPIIISQYYALHKSKINHNNLANKLENCSCFCLICCMKMSN